MNEGRLGTERRGEGRQKPRYWEPCHRFPVAAGSGQIAEAEPSWASSAGPSKGCRSWSTPVAGRRASLPPSSARSSITVRCHRWVHIWLKLWREIPGRKGQQSNTTITNTRFLSEPFSPLKIWCVMFGFIDICIGRSLTYCPWILSSECIIPVL